MIIEIGLDKLIMHAMFVSCAFKSGQKWPKNNHLAAFTKVVQPVQPGNPNPSVNPSNPNNQGTSANPSNPTPSVNPTNPIHPTVTAVLHDHEAETR